MKTDFRPRAFERAQYSSVRALAFLIRRVARYLFSASDKPGLARMDKRHQTHVLLINLLGILADMRSWSLGSFDQCSPPL